MGQFCHVASIFYFALLPVGHVQLSSERATKFVGRHASYYGLLAWKRAVQNRVQSI